MGAVGEIILVFRDMVNMLFTVYIYIIIARAILSWVNPDPYNPIVRFLHNATDPVLNRIRRVVPLQFSGIDFSPLILLFGIYLLQRVVMVLLTRLALGL
ncbi:MAG: YggT family protein [Desulfuromonadales bacterium]|nr:YggT family protein [Desulfuromonadales bacterium]